MSNEHIEEMLELCQTAAEDGRAMLDRDHLPTQMVCFLPSPIEPGGDGQQQAIDAMIRQGLLLADGRRIRLSPAGQARAQEVVRRHRLTEVLLHNVLEVSEASMESTACQAEHILNPEVTEAVCAFLSHPPSCPHGRAIPRGACCEASAATVAPLIIPLSRLPIGQEATVAFIHTARHAYLQRLSALGLAPRRLIRLRQTRPAVVIQLGETELALDAQAGREIFVRRRPDTRYPAATRVRASS